MKATKAKPLIENAGFVVLGWGNQFKFARVKLPTDKEVHVLDISAGIERTKQRLAKLKEQVSPKAQTS